MYDYHNSEKDLIAVVTGCIPGDGSIRPGSPIVNEAVKGNARYRITIIASNHHYIEDLRKTAFKDYNPSELYGYPNSELSQHRGENVKQYHFSTKTAPIFTELHKVWYS